MSFKCELKCLQAHGDDTRPRDSGESTPVDIAETPSSEKQVVADIEREKNESNLEPVEKGESAQCRANYR